ncbi:(p)ppGpp synthetase [Grimontia hollisae]|uniref:RelA/SpoT domain protein n=1 Tax=Grimontia hollisae CIP 101886 TaxID=675812 RepID=D0I3G9_GRIHO|nr:RelA/SpoT domain protein [Grimontia hollisae]AMG30786.1 (p)ppGpp synthetase [Grimontia hollisae]EEY73990.1 RelA/SpoT domain protein [Grimontia hollisae CIP 101886]STO47410.1 GTP pyrophosphokinase ywaC [Grimontia hollisae]
MASLDFEVEKQKFREFYNDNHYVLERAKDSFISIINSILVTEGISISLVSGRVKDREECIKKFSRKYQAKLEENSTEYEIKDYITDILGLRIVCLYEKDVIKIRDILKDEFSVIDETNKILDIESKEDVFGYKGLHMDLQLKEPRSGMKEYVLYRDMSFEIQIRTIVQDAWSVLDHKIKYKKSIPAELKRRINTLAALFELADREFLSIRDETDKLQALANNNRKNSAEPLDVFNFGPSVLTFFDGYKFQSHKVDGFVEEVTRYKNITVEEFYDAIDKNIETVRNFEAQLGSDSTTKHQFNPFTVIRHALYSKDPITYERILYDKQRMAFDAWLGNTKKTETFN